MSDLIRVYSCCGGMVAQRHETWCKHYHTAAYRNDRQLAFAGGFVGDYERWVITPRPWYWRLWRLMMRPL